MKVGDESMSAIFFCTTVKGNLPHLSYIFLDPELLGTDLNTVACYVTGALIFIEVWIVRKGVNCIKYQQELGAAVAGTNRMMEATKGIGHNSRKGETKDCFLFESWLSSNKAAEATMEVGSEFIVMVKTNSKLLCKETVEKLTKDLPGVYYLVLRSKHIVPGGRPLISIGYKYNAQKVLSFIVTDNTGRTQVGPTYLYKCLNQFNNFYIRLVARPLVMSKFFGAVN